MPIYPKYDKKRIPKKNVFVISCIDLRLTDDTVRFLHHDNLANRYDHFTLAGASLCTCVASKNANVKNRSMFDPKVLSNYKDFQNWRTSLDDHLAIAIKLHHIKDVYIIEHANCGAYEQFLKPSVQNAMTEKDLHKHFAKDLAKEIGKTTHQELELDGNGMPIKIGNGYKMKKYKLKVHSYLINLRGDVERL